MEQRSRVQKINIRNDLLQADKIKEIESLRKINQSIKEQMLEVEEEIAEDEKDLFELKKMLNEYYHGLLSLGHDCR